MVCHVNTKWINISTIQSKNTGIYGISDIWEKP